MPKNPDSLSEQEKVKLGISAIKSFFDQFGKNDIYKQIFLEELMKILLEEDEPVHIPNAPKP